MALDCESSERDISQSSSQILQTGLTLDFGQSLLQQLLSERRLGKLGLNARLYSLHQLQLLRFSLLLLVSHPAVQHRLHLGLDRLFLCQKEVLVLDGVRLPSDSVQLLGEGNDVFEGFDGIDTLSDRFGVFFLGGVERIADFLKKVS